VQLFVYPNFKFPQKPKRLKQILSNEKGSFHLPLKTKAKIDEEQDQKIVLNKFIKQVCWLKTLYGLHPFARYDA
jgi:hypothetical protein